MDSNATQLWFAGRFIPPTIRPGSAADAVAASRAVGGAPLAAHIAHAEGIIANECPTLSGSE